MPMMEKKIDGLSLWCFENLSRGAALGHFVSGRPGGVSPPPYDALNLSFNVGDEPEKVRHNRKRLAAAAGIPLTSLTLARQVHDDQVSIVTKDMRGEGAMDHEDAIGETDAMVTNVPEICLMILLADCVPILLFDPSKRVIGAVHAGWKGTLQGVAQKTVKVLHAAFGCSPADLIVGIGPSIGPCCYEVGPDVVSAVKEAFGNDQDLIRRTPSHGKGLFDLWKANLNQLISAGIPGKNIETAGVCTCHHGDRFYSYRYDKGRTGRFGAGIFLRDL